MDSIKAVPPPKPAAETGKRVSYPYSDFASSLTVAELINVRGGGVCDIDQLAAWLEYKSVTSGTFASRLAAARHFGLITNTNDGRIGITDRARSILAPVMPYDAVNAKAEAFLGVALFKQVFDDFRGTVLPEDIGLTNFFKQKYKILPDRAVPAVRVFRDSARQTGFFQSANNRLIRPSASANPPLAMPEIKVTAASDAAESQERRRQTGGGGGGDATGIDPSLLGLLRQLPQPGSPWAPADQTAFLAAFTAVVKFIYPTSEKGEAGNA